MQPYSQRLAGVIAAKDVEKGYHWSPSNTEIQGIVGVERQLTSMINDPTSEVNALNECGVVTVFNSYGSGFRTWGNRSAAYPSSTNPTNFINVRRTADIIHESVEYSMLQFMDYPIDNGLIDSICETVNQFIRTLIGRGALIDGKQLTFLDLFSGIGGFRIGLERAGFKSIGYCDNDEYANKLYKAYFNTEEELFFNDIRTINTEELPDFDILCGGFPDEMIEKAREIGLADSRLYKMAGNAVTVNVVEAVARKIAEVENGRT